LAFLEFGSVSNWYLLKLSGAYKLKCHYFK